MFLTEKHESQAPLQEEEIISAQQVNSFIKAALEKVVEAFKWTRHQINIDQQMHEASFIYRRVLQALN